MIAREEQRGKRSFFENGVMVATWRQKERNLRREVDFVMEKRDYCRAVGSQDRIKGASGGIRRG